MQVLTVAGERETHTSGDHAEQVGLAQAVTVAGAQDVSVALWTVVAVGAAAALNVGGGYAINVGGAINEAVAGVKSSQVGGEAIVVVGAHSEERVAKERTTTIGDDYEAMVHDSARLLTDKDETINVGAGGQVSAGPLFSLNTAEGKVQAEKIIVEVGGKKMLVLDANGIQIFATNFTIEGTQIQLKGGTIKKVAPDSAEATANWVELELVDGDGNAVGNEPYELHLPNGEVKKGRLDGGGKARVEGIPRGSGRVVFPRVGED
jgi:type VI secretion system secreted protein VgrG